MKKIVILTLFKNMLDEFLKSNAIKKAIEQKKVSIDLVDIRDFTNDKHKRVDFPPYGGGTGMIISCEPLCLAIDYSLNNILNSEKENTKIIYMSPRGKLLNYNLSKEISDDGYNYVIICGHYEGIDERVIEEYDIMEISIGDYVLTGGELACLVLLDSIIRLMPGVLSDGALDEESHTDNLLEYPQYTKPSEFRGRKVPEILISGNHQKINEYRKQESIRITKKYRPELLQKDK